MRILLIHNRYRERGGEDVVFDRERALLESRGHDVRVFLRDNADTGTAPVASALSAIWSRSAHAEVAEICARFRPEIVHAHNTHFAISPSVFAAAKASGAATVLTLHNFRLLCVNALLYRAGAPCERCVGRGVAWPGIVHACFRGSRGASATVAAVSASHRLRGTWARAIDRYVALSGFARERFVAGGVPADRIRLKPNFADPPAAAATPGGRDRKQVLYAGRLSAEKGVGTLIDAWRDIDADLVVAGDGPMRAELEARAGPRIDFRGALEPAAVSAEMARSAAVVCPSECYENFPMVIAEAYAHGTPVIASRIGSLAELVDEGATGLLFAAGDRSALRAAAARLTADAALQDRLGAAARRTFDDRYAADRVYDRLMEIYREARGG